MLAQLLYVPLRLTWALGVELWCVASGLAYWSQILFRLALLLAHALLLELALTAGVLACAHLSLTWHVRRRRGRFGRALRPGVARPQQADCESLPQDAQRLVLSFVPPGGQRPAASSRSGLLGAARPAFVEALGCATVVASLPVLFVAVARRRSPGYWLTARRLGARVEIAADRQMPRPRRRDDVTVCLLGCFGLLVVAGCFRRRQDAR
mmetsp:Transcript_97869/g.315082  ORF Transcript_97869/g.315082 Transcript_97869/m.315082 type:complete len:209 (+) Transcript_97869:37-663(+)